MTTFLLIDGENFKGKIRDVFKEVGKNKPIWHEYDFKGLLDKVLQGIDIEKSIFYFAKIKEDPQTREKSKRLIEEQRLLKTHLEKQGFEVILTGRVRGHMENNGSSEKSILVFKEKGVDVKIAVDMVSWSCDKKSDQIILGSSDSDLQPAIKEIRKRGTNCIYLGFETQPNKGLTYTTNRTILIRNSEIMEFESRINKDTS
ncbi:MAG: NYN domain-containing protein [Candidatus Wolfebacteria bacterium]|nr:NYN domain-containing protein [Candidatus Wolfebacteria bacterium]